MAWRNLIALVAIACGAPAGAESLASMRDRVTHLLDTGQPDQALEVCREARVEYPDSDEILFALGSAEAAAAEGLLARNTPEASAELFRTARETFNRVADGGTPRFRESAAYNAATCLLYRDNALDGKYTERVDNLVEAVDALDDFLHRYPDHERARINLDYARYTLNWLRRNPPGDESPPEDGQDGADPKPVSEVDIATTDLPNASVEVVNGSTVVLRRLPEGPGEP